MKSIISFTLAILLTGSVNCFAQDGVLTSLPTTKEEFVQSEPAVIATINWLEQTPLDQEADQRKLQNALLIGWITNSPTVSLTLDQKLTPFIKKNEQLLILFIGGYTRYCLQNNYSKDEVQCNLAGIRSAMAVYKKGVAVKKDKEMEKLIALEEKGELEGWVKENVGKK